MSGTPKASEIKKRYKELCSALPEGLSLSAVLNVLANDAGCRRALVENFEGSDEQALRRGLALLGPFMDEMQAWVEPASAGGEGRGDVADSSARDSLASDPSILRQAGRVKLFTDGASKGNPGPASVGIVIQDLEGETLYETGIYLGVMTNNAAEYLGLVKALELIVENGAPETYAFLDSALVVNQVNLEWKVKKAELMPYFNRVQQLKRRLPRFQIRHVGRADNARADELANLAFRQQRDAGTL